MSTVKKSTVKGSFLTFKGKPLVRQGHMIVWGSMQDEYIMQMIVLKNKKVELNGVTTEIPDKVIVQITKKNPDNPAERIPVKQFDKNGLHDALMIGYNYIQALEKK